MRHDAFWIARILLDAAGLAADLPGLGPDGSAASLEPTPSVTSGSAPVVAADAAIRSSAATASISPSTLEVSGDELVFRVRPIPTLESNGAVGVALPRMPASADTLPAGL